VDAGVTGVTAVRPAKSGSLYNEGSTASPCSFDSISLTSKSFLGFEGASSHGFGDTGMSGTLDDAIGAVEGGVKLLSFESDPDEVAINPVLANLLLTLQNKGRRPQWRGLRDMDLKGQAKSAMSHLRKSTRLECRPRGLY